VTDGITDTPLGTRGYQAPEIMKGDLYSEKCDIWSLGVVTWQILHNDVLFPENFTDRAILEMMANEDFKFNDDVSPAARDFISSCLRFDPDRRPSAAELLTHPWLQ
jgi:serine/threonine protein kinase